MTRWGGVDMSGSLNEQLVRAMCDGSAAPDIWKPRLGQNLPARSNLFKKEWWKPELSSPEGRRRSLLSLEDVGQHGARGGQLTHLTQELGLGVFTHQTGGNGHGPEKRKGPEKTTG